LILGSIKAGSKWFVRSDLKGFFQTIPKPMVEKFLSANISDAEFVALFMEALSTELSNEEEVRQQIELFPLGEVGVPQGSALSALCANIVLADFDTRLNGRGILTVRYLDDFVILGKDRRAVLKAWGQAQQILRSLGMECHDPSEGTGKAAMGEIAIGFEFLSFHIDDRDVFPSDNARKDFLTDLRDTIDHAKKNISAAKDERRRAEPRFVQSLNLLDQKIRGWGDAFSATNKKIVLAQLDAEIDKMLSAYFGWFAKFRNGRNASHIRRLTGIALVVDGEAK